MAHPGIKVSVTDKGYVMLVAQKNGESISFGLEPFDSDRLARELQSATSRAINIRNGDPP